MVTLVYPSFDWLYINELLLLVVMAVFDFIIVSKINVK
jgi:hypothetical protein